MTDNIPEKVMIDLGLTTEGVIEDSRIKKTHTPKDNSVSFGSQDAQIYKEHLSLLIARGKTKEFIGKTITYSDLDKMSPKELEKNYKLYEAAQASKINQAVTNGVINLYTKVCGYITKADEKKLTKLNQDLKNDFLVTNEIEQWSCYLSFKMGGVMSLISASLITFENIGTINGTTANKSGDTGNQTDTSTQTKKRKNPETN